MAKSTRQNAGKQPSARGKLTQTQKAAGKLIADWARKSGLDTKALAKLQEQRQLEIRDLAEEARANAIQEATALQPVIRDHAAALQALAKEKDFFKIPSFTLDKPVRISSRPTNILRTSRIKPFDSFAKFRADRTREGRDRCIFTYEWTNDSIHSVAIDAITFISASGFLEMSVAGGFTFNFGTMAARAEISLGVSLGRSIVHESKPLSGEFMALNMPFVPFDGHDARGAHGAFNLIALHHPVAPSQKILIFVTLTVESDCGSDFESTADFDSGLLGVSCPVVVVRVHQAPQVSTPD